MRLWSLRMASNRLLKEPLMTCGCSTLGHLSGTKSFLTHSPTHQRENSQEWSRLKQTERCYSLEDNSEKNFTMIYGSSTSIQLCGIKSFSKMHEHWWSEVGQPILPQLSPLTRATTTSQCIAIAPRATAVSSVTYTMASHVWVAQTALYAWRVLIKRETWQYHAKFATLASTAATVTASLAQSALNAMTLSKRKHPWG